MSGAVNRNGHMNDSCYHSAGARHEIEIENEGVADAVDYYLLPHCHDESSVGGKGGCHRGRLNKWAPWVSMARRPLNGASETMLVMKDSY